MLNLGHGANSTGSAMNTGNSFGRGSLKGATPLRQQFLERTIEEFARTGPGAFNPGKIARELGVTVAMINHYFGSRYGLIAEAAYLVYSSYIDELFEAVRSAPRVPEDRLRAWMETQIVVSRRVGGWGVVLNYPTFSLKDSLAFDANYSKSVVRKYELNLARLAQLIIDLKAGSVSPEEVAEQNLDLDKFLSNPKLVALGSSIAMSTLGASVWFAGSHAPSADSVESRKRAEFALESHIEILVQLAKSTDL